MSLANHLPKIVIASLLLGGGAVVVSKIAGSSPGDAMVNVKVPQLSQQAKRGKKDFDANCAQCHGDNASGSKSGPPLIHDIYNPGHHSDPSFQMAAKRGVKRHHWNFGNMPPQPQINERQISSITFYIRELQTANGISYREHKM